MKKTITAIAIVLMTSSMAFAGAGGVPNANAANGQAKKAANCAAVIAKQNANGQTGGATGSDTDPKDDSYIGPTAVTNCDGFWQAVGAIGPD